MRVPLLNFERGPGILLLNFEGGPGVPLLNFERGLGSRVPGSWGPGPTFTPCLLRRRGGGGGEIKLSAIR